MSADRAGGPLRVVIVDDTADLRALLRLALETGGFDVVAEAADGRQGIDAAREHDPDLILLDLAMPVMDGLEALPLLRTTCPDATIVVLSGIGAAQMTRKAMAAGADGYLQKGVPVKSILAYVRDLTGGSVPRPPRALAVVPDPPAVTPTTTAAPSPADDHEPPTVPAAAGPTAAGPTATGPTATGPTATGPTATGSTATGPTATGSAGTYPALPDAVRRAPFGVLEVLDEPIFRLVAANDAAAQLLGRAGQAGTPLFALTPTLAGQLAQHRGEESSVFVVPLVGGQVTAALRQTTGSLFVLLLPGEAEDAIRPLLDPPSATGGDREDLLGWLAERARGGVAER